MICILFLMRYFELDIANYGIHINVSFRANEKPKRLDHQVNTYAMSSISLGSIRGRAQCRNYVIPACSSRVVPSTLPLCR